MSYSSFCYSFSLSKLNLCRPGSDELFQRTERSAEAGVEDVPEYSGKPAAPQMHCQALWYSTMHCRIVQCTVLQYNATVVQYNAMW